MKHLIMGVFMLIVHAGMSCELHGVSIGGTPLMKQNFIGLNFQSGSAIGAHQHFGGGAHDHSSSSIEYAHRATLFGRIKLVKDLFIDFSVPYVMNTTSEIYGVGDPNVGVLKMLEVYSVDSSNTSINLFGMGHVSVPLGQHKNDHLYDPTNQPGTGAISGDLSWGLYAQRKSFGVEFTQLLALNGTNKFGYRFSNRMVIDANVYGQLKKGELNSFWFVGVNRESSSYDEYMGESQYNTGGITSFAQLKTQLQYKSMMLTADVKVPFSSVRYGAQGAIGNRFSLSLSYLF